MKKLFIATLCMCAMSLSAQNHTLSVVMGSSPTDIYTNSDIIGGPSYNGRTSTLLGINYFYTFAKHFQFATGVEYSHNNYVVEPSYMPDVPLYSHHESIKLISIPLGIRTTFLKYLFLYTGASIDNDFSTSGNNASSMTGLGWNLGLGAQYSYRNVVTYINPFVQQHATVSLAGEDDTRQKLMLSGFRFGIGYKF